jgi:hypothetical protein
MGLDGPDELALGGRDALQQAAALNWEYLLILGRSQCLNRLSPRSIFAAIL